MDLITMKMVCDLIDTASFSRAAEQNYLTQSAVSQRLKTLERELGQRLLDRGQGKGKVSATEAGLIFYAGARSIISEVVELEWRLKGLSLEISGALKIAAVYSLGLHVLPNRLKAFMKEYPLVRVHLEYCQTSRVYQQITAGTVDVGVVASPVERSGIILAPFCTESMALICSPSCPQASQETFSLAELNTLPMIGFSAGIPTRHLIDRQLALKGVQANIIAEYDNIETIKHLVELGQGVAIVPQGTAHAEAAAGTLCLLPLHPEDAFFRQSSLMIKPQSRSRSAIAAFCDFMKDSIEVNPKDNLNSAGQSCSSKQTLQE